MFGRRQEYKAWKISYDRFKDPPLIPIDQLIFISSMALERVPRDKEIITVCAHGNRSYDGFKTPLPIWI